MGRRNRRWLACASLAMTMALVATACGDDDDDDGTADTAASETTAAETTTTAAAAATTTTAAGGEEETTTSGGAASGETTTTNQFSNLEKLPEPNPCPEIPGVSDTEIKIGVILIQSGPLSTSSGPSLDGLQARIDKANETGELGDRKISLVVVDDQGDTTRSGEVARQLIESENVYAISITSNGGTGTYEYFAENGIPVTGWHLGQLEWNKLPNMFTFRQANDPDPELYTTRNAKVLKEVGATKVALIGGQNESSARFMNQIAATVEMTEGLELVYKTNEVVPGQNDFTAIVQNIKESGADGFYTGMDFLQNAALSQQLTDAGVEVKARIFPGGYSPQILGLPGTEGVMFGVEFFPFESNPPAFQEFDKYMPEDKVRSQITYIGWLNGEILIEGIKQAGINCPTRENFINNLRLVDDYDGGGAFDPVDLSASFGHGFQCTYYVQVQDKQFVPLFDGEAICGEPVRIEL
jgi:ABC-type branched-subunit amino acid transport system substrate-binding protein